eukprot:4062795-Amphidinium_carterae.1
MTHHHGQLTAAGLATPMHLNKRSSLGLAGFPRQPLSTNSLLTPTGELVKIGPTGSSSDGPDSALASNATQQTTRT